MIPVGTTSEKKCPSPAALFNPSIVKHRNQRNLAPGAMRFIMSFRATGEGHISSIVFRTGIIHRDHSITVEPPSRFTHRVRTSPDRLYEKQLFHRKLHDIGVEEATVGDVLGRLPDRFTLVELEQAVTSATEAAPEKFVYEQTCKSMLWLGR